MTNSITRNLSNLILSLLDHNRLLTPRTQHLVHCLRTQIELVQDTAAAVVARSREGERGAAGEAATCNILHDEFVVLRYNNCFLFNYLFVVNAYLL